MGIVGVNGSGKSTLIRTLAHLQRPLSGDVCLRGTPLRRYAPEALAKELSITLAERIPTKNMTVSELVALGRQPYTNWIGTLAQRDIMAVEQALETVQLQDLRGARCYELSDGQLQRALIARALAQDTDLLLLDEPTTHLDFHHKATVLLLLQAIAREKGKTVLFSSHEIELIIPLCDALLVITEGTACFDTPTRLIEKGIFDRLFPKELIGFEALSGRFKIRP